MKFILSILFCLTAMLSFSQEELSLQLRYNAADSTYYFVEIRKFDGKEVGKKNIPDNGATFKKDAFTQYVRALITSETERLQESKRIQKKIGENIAFLSAAIDSVAGAGTAANFQVENLRQALQGPWSLITRTGNEEPDVTTMTIQGEDVATSSKAGKMQWVDAEKFTMKSGGIFAFNLTFTKAGDRYVAERTANGVTTKYILKR